MDYVGIMQICRTCAAIGLTFLMGLSTVCVTILLDHGRVVPDALWALAASKLAALVYIVHTAPKWTWTHSVPKPESKSSPHAP